eukprot:TRINITY_DN84170_c0_g1_i1.p1 TRINITY_DN84170_c0_g1~~TRINITY_DN84170_c0_g1_i1.p1  ORF type:complete len:318 (+),score=24.48 TRINITY_DN84170_c0_g1_i1:348-1301(+)
MAGYASFTPVPRHYAVTHCGSEELSCTQGLRLGEVLTGLRGFICDMDYTGAIRVIDCIIDHIGTQRADMKREEWDAVVRNPPLSAQESLPPLARELPRPIDLEHAEITRSSPALPPPSLLGEGHKSGRPVANALRRRGLLTKTAGGAVSCSATTAGEADSAPMTMPQSLSLGGEEGREAVDGRPALRPPPRGGNFTNFRRKFLSSSSQRDEAAAPMDVTEDEENSSTTAVSSSAVEPLPVRKLGHVGNWLRQRIATAQNFAEGDLVEEVVSGLDDSAGGSVALISSRPVVSMRQRDDEDEGVLTHFHTALSHSSDFS